MPKRPLDSYSVKAGDSVYPIEEGFVFKLQKPYKVKNRKVGAIVEHDAYLWIMKIHKGPKSKAPKDRKILITKVLIPKIKDLKNKYLIEKRNVQKETVCKYLLNYGYEVHARNVPYYYKKHDYYSFYVAVGLISNRLNVIQKTTL